MLPIFTLPAELLPDRIIQQESRREGAMLLKYYLINLYTPGAYPDHLWQDYNYIALDHNFGPKSCRI